VLRRGWALRPKTAIRVAPACAKYRAVSAPMPVPPPVMSTILSLTESSGRIGDSVGYVFECQVEVGDGNGAAMIDG
jgi:hypothetical protein